MHDLTNRFINARLKVIVKMIMIRIVIIERNDSNDKMLRLRLDVHYCVNRVMHSPLCYCDQTFINVSKHLLQCD